MDLATLTPKEARRLIRENRLNRKTGGVANGYVQANLVVLRKHLAFNFFLFCQRNPKPCPILDVTEIGSYVPERIAPDADLRTDLGGYRVYRNGELAAKKQDISDDWEDGMVAFLLGCSHTFEKALLDHHIPVRHIEMGLTMVPTYNTTVPCVKAGSLEGPLVVSMRPIPRKDLVRTIQITSRYPGSHGAPIHIGDPKALGIRDLDRPDYGSPVLIHEGEVPVFWACGVTPQTVAMHSGPDLMITHEPGDMFIADITDESIAIH